jgi:hypothetical protein
MERLFRTTIFGLLAMSTAVGGCHDPRHVKQSEIRRQRIDQHVRQFRDYDAAGPERVQQTLDLQSQLREYHQESLNSTVATTRRLHERKVQKWESDRELRRERAHRYLRGKPEEIDDTWAKMVY